MCAEYKTCSPSDNLFYDLLVQDSAMLTVCFHYSALRKSIIFSLIRRSGLLKLMAAIKGSPAENLTSVCSQLHVNFSIWM